MTPDDFRAWRARLGLSQVGASVALGVTPKAVENWEGGSTPIRRVVVLATRWLEEHPEERKP